MAELAGCLIEPLDDSGCRATLAWVTGTGGAPTTECVDWLLAYCYSGVTWGRLDHNTLEWRLACTAFAARAPMPGEQNLRELRLFGKARESLIWREERGFRGRGLATSLAVKSIFVLWMRAESSWVTGCLKRRKVDSAAWEAPQGQNKLCLSTFQRSCFTSPRGRCGSTCATIWKPTTKQAPCGLVPRGLWGWR